LLVVGVGLLVARSLESIESGESMRHQIVADRMFDAMEEELSDLIESEEARSFLEYRYFYAPEGGEREALTRSPLSRPADRDYIVGYFQLEPDGSLLSPRRPRDVERAIDLYGWSVTTDLQREEQQLGSLTRGLRDQMATRWENLLDEGIVVAEAEPVISTRRAPDPPPVKTSTKLRDTKAEITKKRQALKLKKKQDQQRKSKAVPTPEPRNQKAVLDKLNRGASKRAGRSTKSEPVSTDNAYFQLPEELTPIAIVNAELPEVEAPQDMDQAVRSIEPRKSVQTELRTSNRKRSSGPIWRRQKAQPPSSASEEAMAEAPSMDEDDREEEEDDFGAENAVAGAAAEVWPGEGADALADGDADVDQVPEPFADDRRTAGVQRRGEADGETAAERELNTGFDEAKDDTAALVGATGGTSSGADAGGVLSNDSGAESSAASTGSLSDTTTAQPVFAEADPEPQALTEEAQSGELAEPEVVVTREVDPRAAAALDGLAKEGVNVEGLEGILERERADEFLGVDVARIEEAKPDEQSLADGREDRVSPEMTLAAAVEAAGPASEFVDVRISPLRGLRVDEQHLVLHRAVRVGELIWRQGLVLRVPDLVGHLQAEVLDEELAGFVDLRWDVPSSHGPAEVPMAGLFRFGHQFAAPFTALAATATLSKLPLEGRDPQSWVLLLSLLLGVVGLVGFGALYRMVSVVVHFAERRNNFVAAVSHELKTPLTAIRMYGEILREGMVPSEEKRQEYYGTITAESERLSRLIDNVLELSRLEKGTRSVNPTVGSIGPVLEEVARILRPHARNSGFELEVVSDPDLPAATFDRDALQQVLINLVDNALKFAKNADDKVVTIACERVGDELMLRVRDRGPGVPLVQVGRVFQPFFRGERELTRRTKGTGIGLALVKGLVEQMGGRVLARNHPGGGFEVSIALVPAGA
jgi:signal transduction histidine kinase